MSRRSRLDHQVLDELLDEMCMQRRTLTLSDAQGDWESRFLTYREKDSRQLWLSYPEAMPADALVRPGTPLVGEFERQRRTYTFDTRLISQGSHLEPEEKRHIRAVQVEFPNELFLLQRREHRRVRIDPRAPIPVTLVIDPAERRPGASLPPLESFLKDISGGGLSLTVPAPSFLIEEGLYLQCLFTLKDGEPPLGVLAQVRDLDHTGAGVHLAMTFTERSTGIHDKRCRKRIVEFVAECERARRGTYNRKG